MPVDEKQGFVTHEQARSLTLPPVRGINSLGAARLILRVLIDYGLRAEGLIP